MGILFKATDKLPELPLGQATAYRLAGRHPEYEGPNKLRVGPDYLRGCRIIRHWSISDGDVAAVRALLMNVKTYTSRNRGKRCFFPGFAFTFGEGTVSVDVLVCLDCRWVVFHFGNESVSVVPSDKGLARLQEVYRTLIEKEPSKAT